MFPKSRFRTQTGPIGPKTGPKPDLTFEAFYKVSVEQKISEIGLFLRKLEVFIYAIAVILQLSKMN